MTGLQRLREEAFATGKAEGKAELLLRQLELRFGQLPLDVPHRVREATAEQLELWTERVLTAPNLESVLS